jgi:hypothetical protein
VGSLTMDGFSNNPQHCYLMDSFFRRRDDRGEADPPQWVWGWFRPPTNGHGWPPKIFFSFIFFIF